MAHSNRRNKQRNNRKMKKLQKEYKKGAGYSFIVKKNEAFENYYKNLGIVNEEEWDEFISSMKQNLPSSFRITGTRSHAKVLLKIFQDYYNQLSSIIVDGTPVEKPFCLPWYPDGLAWQMKFGRTTIRKSDALAKLHSFFISETESGNISRQETVSMIPPLLLDVKPHHKVLDMCAAPGSKTAQLIEMLHSDDRLTVPEGFVIGNDSDNKRCYLLVHQAKRLQSPCFMITNHDASFMPNIRYRLPSGEIIKLHYDRILCDVPCSGDGTIRKNPDVWKKWNSANGNNLHGVQSRLLRRGVELLDIGGLLAYSTCSLNPIENEANISSILLQSEGSLELVDVSDKLPGLKYRCGLSSWKVMSREMVWYTDPDLVPENRKTQMRPSLFPPPQEIAENLHLDRCVRIHPHLQDTGGFFVAILRKVKPLPWEKIKPPKTTETQEPVMSYDNENDEPPFKKRRLFGFKEDPFVFFRENEDVWPQIQNFYQVNENFPYTQLLTRSFVGKKKNVYFVSKAIKDIIAHNSDRLKIINSGIRLLCRNNGKDSACCFRLAQEGLQTWLPFLSGRRLNIMKADLVTLLTSENPFISKMCNETRSALKAYDNGSLIFIYKSDERERDDQFSIELVGWKGKSSVRCFVPKNERLHYLRLCGFDTSQYESQEIKERKQKHFNESETVQTIKCETLPLTNLSETANSSYEIRKDTLPVEQIPSEDVTSSNYDSIHSEQSTSKCKDIEIISENLDSIIKNEVLELQISDAVDSFNESHNEQSQPEIFDTNSDQDIRNEHFQIQKNSSGIEKMVQQINSNEENFSKSPIGTEGVTSNNDDCIIDCTEKR